MTLIEIGIAWAVFINIAAISLFQLDKVYARQKSWRISDKYFLTLAVTGGALGALVGSQIMRNKTRRRGFIMRLKIIVFIQIVIMVVYIHPELNRIFIHPIMEVDVLGKAKEMIQIS